MVWMFLIWICQVTGTFVSLLEMMKSEYDSRSAINGYYPRQDSALPPVLLDDFVQLRFICHMLKYTGAISLVLGFIVLTYQCCKTKLRSVRDIWSPSAWFLSLQLLGVSALVVRLVVLFLYTSRHICDTNIDEERSLEPNCIMLGIAAIFGLVTSFLYIGHVFAFTYNKCIHYEKDTKQQGIKQTSTNIYAIAVHTSDPLPLFTECKF